VAENLLYNHCGGIVTLQPLAVVEKLLLVNNTASSMAGQFVNVVELFFYWKNYFFQPPIEEIV
jgi:hypothetical protein